MIDICLLGCGGVVPMQNRWLTSLLIKYKGRMILIDCGEGTQIPINITKWGFKNIDAILFTHYHADHIAGLPGLLLTIGNSGRTQPLDLFGPLGLEEVVKGLTVISPQLPFEIRINQDIMFFEDIIIKSLPVDHTLNCFAYSFELKRNGKFNVENATKLKVPVSYWKLLQKGESVIVGNKKIHPDDIMGMPRKGIKVCYCTDTRPIYELVDFIKNADIFICEGMYGDDENLSKAVIKKHMLFSEAATLSKLGNVKELWLTHYSPSLSIPDEYIKNATDIFSNTKAGKDLTFKTIVFEDD